MKKGLIIISMIFISAMAASAQTNAKGEVARRDHAVAKKTHAPGSRDKERGQGVLRVGPSTTYLKKGLKAYEVVRFLGWPLKGIERRDGDLRLATYTFARGEGRVLVAEFENDSLVSFHTAEANAAVAENKDEASGR
jgi:hypothetical protein